MEGIVNYSLIAKEVGISQELLKRVLNLFGKWCSEDDIISALKENNLNFFYNKVRNDEMSDVVRVLSEAFSLM